MRIGILSDTHGSHSVARRAIDALENAGADLFIHLGDLDNERILDLLAGLNARVVFGNCDDVSTLDRCARHLGLRVDHPLGEFAAGDKRICFTHGHLERQLLEALQSQPDYLLHGHTHQVRDDRVGRTRVINPGALHRAPRYTVALLDPSVDQVDWLDVER